MTFKPVENPIMTFDLETPIQVFGEPVHSISIREPNAGDMLRVGNPVKYDARTDDLTFDELKSFAMLSRLSGLPIEGSLDRMTTNDAVTCFWGFARFFIPGLRKAPQDLRSKKQDEPPVD